MHHWNRDHRILPFLRLLLTLLSICFSPITLGKESVKVAVASNFNTTAKALVDAFEKKTANDIKLTFASSGKIYAQIVHGAPFDIFLSADDIKPRLLVEKGYAETKDVFTYALGELVLWSNEKRFVDSKGKALKDGEVLKKGEFSRVAIANPRVAPYGAAAKSVIENLGLTDKLSKKLIQGENISQAFQFVSSGNAELGFIAYSQVLPLLTEKLGAVDNSSSIWKIPPSIYPPIQQDAVLLRRAEKNKAATDFFNFLKSKEAKIIISQSGYQVTE